MQSESCGACAVAVSRVQSLNQSDIAVPANSTGGFFGPNCEDDACGGIDCGGVSHGR